MSVRIVGTQLSDPGPVGARKPLLVLGPSLGTSVHALWAPCVRDLADRFHLVGWDLPGHGASPAANGSAMDFTDLAAAVIDLVDAVQEERGEPIGSFAYAGDSASGAVGLQLLLDAPDRVRDAVILCSSAAFGVMPGWLDRAAAARASGTAALVPLSLQRWFTDGFAEREPERVSALLHSLRETDDESYAQVCEALSRFDVRDRLSDVTVPLLAPVLTVVFITMLINVLKVFDIVISVAPGSVQDDANVLALAMWRTSFGGTNNFGVGSAIAVFIFILVIPLLALNVRRFRREQ